MERMTFVLGIDANLLDDTLDKTLGECFEALPWIERFNGSTFVKSVLVESLRTAWKRMECTKVPRSALIAHNCMESDSRFS